jgi:hypothetical protein
VEPAHVEADGDLIRARAAKRAEEGVVNDQLRELDGRMRQGQVELEIRIRQVRLIAGRRRGAPCQIAPFVKLTLVTAVVGMRKIRAIA